MTVAAVVGPVNVISTPARPVPFKSTTRPATVTSGVTTKSPTWLAANAAKVRLAGAMLAPAIAGATVNVPPAGSPAKAYAPAASVLVVCDAGPASVTWTPLAGTPDAAVIVPRMDKPPGWADAGVGVKAPTAAPSRTATIIRVITHAPCAPERQAGRRGRG